MCSTQSNSITNNENCSNEANLNHENRNDNDTNNDEVTEEQQRNNGDILRSNVVQITDEESSQQQQHQQSQNIEYQQQETEETKICGCGSDTCYFIFKITRDMLITTFIGYVIIDSFVTKLLSSDNNDAPITNYQQWIQDNPTIAVCLSILGYFVNTVLCTPIMLLAISEIVFGFIFCRSLGFSIGLILSTASVFLGNCIGAITAFLVGRYILMNWVHQELTPKYPIMKTLDLAVYSSSSGATNQQRQVSLKILCLLRICPLLMPYNEINYIIGAKMMTIPFQWYLWSLFTMVPFILLLALGGATVQAYVH